MKEGNSKRKQENGVMRKERKLEEELMVRVKLDAFIVKEGGSLLSPWLLHRHQA